MDALILCVRCPMPAMCVMRTLRMMRALRMILAPARCLLCDTLCCVSAQGCHCRLTTTAQWVESYSSDTCRNVFMAYVVLAQLT
jgi:hypothetical protein